MASKSEYSKKVETEEDLAKKQIVYIILIN